MQYRTVRDLHEVIIHSLPALPRDIDVVVGIPRSGMLPATLISLHLNTALADFDGFLSGRVLSKGHRPYYSHLDSAQADRMHVLIVDDSVGHGTQMRQVQTRVLKADLPYNIMYAAVFVTPECRDLVDYAFEELEWGRMFSWNVMHHAVLKDCCVDIDGVLCVDPTSRQKEDTPEYEEFLRNTKPLFLPGPEVGWLVTGRLEKYRSATEEWLAKHGVKYRHLVMLDQPDRASKQANGGGAPFKASVYRQSDAKLFIESSEGEARIIAKLTGKPVLCVGTQAMVYPDLIDRVQSLPRRNPKTLLRHLGKRSLKRLGLYKRTQR